MGFFSELFDNNSSTVSLRSKPRRGRDSAFSDTGPSSLAPISDFQLTGSGSAQILAEIDIDAAVVAHESWKQRLSNYVAGTSQEKLNASVVCLDNQCLLGKWIHGNGKAMLGTHQSFAMLIEQHQRFHIEAATVVRLADGKKYTEATEVINKNYAHASKRVVWLLQNLKRNIQYMSLFAVA
jgi:Chemoreceptor zinc-binding domain